MTNVTVESLKKTHGDNAVEVYNEIAEIVGAERSSGGEFSNNEGGIDLTGFFDTENKVFTAATRTKVQNLITTPKKDDKADKPKPQTGS